MNHAAFAHAAEQYNLKGGEIAYEIRQAFRGAYLATRDIVDAGQRSAEVAQARARIAARGY